MKKPKNANITPRGGWTVKIPQTGAVISHPNNPNAFLGLVKAHLVANNLDSLGWRDVVWDLVCEQNPSVECEDCDVPPRSMTMEDVKRFVRTMIEARDAGAEAVSDEVQSDRIEVCLRCPLKTSISCFSGCGWLSDALNWFSLGRKAPKYPEVHKQHCGPCGCDIALKTQYPLDVLKRVDGEMGFSNENYHAACWMREASPEASVN